MKKPISRKELHNYCKQTTNTKSETAIGRQQQQSGKDGNKDDTAQHTK